MSKRRCVHCGEEIPGAYKFTKRFCSQQCQRRAANARSSTGKSKLRPVICEGCGMSFVRNRVDQIFCSIPCQRRAAAARQYERQTAAIIAASSPNCAHCSRPILSRQRHAIYCSPECQLKASAWRQARNREAEWRGVSPTEEHVGPLNLDRIRAHWERVAERERTNPRPPLTPEEWEARTGIAAAAEAQRKLDEARRASVPLAVRRAIATQLGKPDGAEQVTQPETAPVSRPVCDGN